MREGIRHVPPLSAVLRKARAGPADTGPRTRGTPPASLRATPDPDLTRLFGLPDSTPLSMTRSLHQRNQIPYGSLRGPKCAHLSYPPVMPTAPPSSQRARKTDSKLTEPHMPTRHWKLASVQYSLKSTGFDSYSSAANDSHLESSCQDVLS